MPIVATDLPQVDAGGFTSDVDGLTRTADALGNTLVLETRHGVTTLAYDGLSRLRRATGQSSSLATRTASRAASTAASRSSVISALSSVS